MKTQHLTALFCFGLSLLSATSVSAESWANKPQQWECESGRMQARVCASRMGEAQLKAVGKLCSKETAPTDADLKACILGTLCIALHKQCN